MGSNAPIEKILSNTYTMADVYKRLLLLEDFLQHTLYASAHQEGSATQLLRSHYQLALEREIAERVAEWGDSFLSFFNAENVHDQMETLKATVAQLPTLILYVPVYFEQKEITSLGSWCRAQINSQLMLDLRIDPSVTGGCTFVWKNVLHDFSLGYFMQKHEKEFFQILQTLPLVPAGVN